jgi:hypothetical protein
MTHLRYLSLKHLNFQVPVGNNVNIRQVPQQGFLWEGGGHYLPGLKAGIVAPEL